MTDWGIKGQPADEQSYNKERLFREHKDLLTWEQWNYLFKTVAKRNFRERQRMPKDYSKILSETVS